MLLNKHIICTAAHIHHGAVKDAYINWWNAYVERKGYAPHKELSTGKVIALPPTPGENIYIRENKMIRSLVRFKGKLWNDATNKQKALRMHLLETNIRSLNKGFLFLEREKILKKARRRLEEG